MIRVFILTVSAFTLFATSFSQITSESIFVNGVSRSYLLYLPDGFMMSDALPLVICFHGGSGTASEQLALGDLRDHHHLFLIVLVGFLWNDEKYF